MIDNQKNLNFEYTPIETEFLNNSDNNIYSPKKDRLISQENQQSFSIDEDNYDNLEYEKEIAAIEKKTKNNILFQINTLESLRISKDDSTTLYEQINGKKEEEKFETPNKKNLKNNYNFKINDNFCKKNIFSYENNKKNNNNNKFNIEKELNIDFKKELEKNLKEIFEKKGKLYKLKFNHFNNNNNNNNTIKNKNNNNSKKKLNDIHQQITNYNNYNNNTIQKKTLNNNNYKEKISYSSSKNSCNTTIKKNNKTKCIYQIKKNNIPIQKKPNKRKLSKEKNISNSMTNTTNCSTTRKNNNDKININNIHIKEFSPKPPIKNKKFIPHSGIKIQKPIAYFSHNYSYRNVYRAQTELNNNNNKENMNNSNYNNFYNYNNNNNNLTSRISKKSNSLKEKRKISLKKNESNLSINFEKKNKKNCNKISKKNINLSTSKHENKYKLFTKDILLSNKNKNNNNNKIDFYKNNIKNITIAPISSITSKLFIRNNINNKNLSYKNIENSFNNYKNKLNYFIKTDRFGKKKMNIINNKNNSTKNSFHTITYN